MSNLEHLDQLSGSAHDWKNWREKHPNVKIDLSSAHLNKEVFNRKLIAISRDYTPIVSLVFSLIYLAVIWVIISQNFLEELKITSNLILVFLTLVFLLGFRIFLSGLTIFISGQIISRLIMLLNLPYTALNLSNFDLHDADLSHSDLSGADLSKTNLSSANLTGANLTRARASEANFSNASMTGVCVKEWQCGGAKFDGAKCLFFYQDEERKERYPVKRDFDDNEFSKLLQDAQKKNRSLKLLSVRLEKGKDSENLSKITQLIDGSTIEAVFDPYLDDNGLKNLEKLYDFEASLSPNIKILTSKKGAKRLKKEQINHFFERCSNLGAIRQMRNLEHRRFLLLSSGYALIIGCSLNDISKNEVASLEFDLTDRNFFDSEWESASKVNET